MNKKNEEQRKNSNKNYATGNRKPEMAKTVNTQHIKSKYGEQ